MRRHIAAWCIVALGLGGLAACAQPVGSVTAGSGSSTAPSPSPVTSSAPAVPSPAPSGTMTPPIIVGSPPGPVESSGGRMSLSGQIYAGAEPSCLLLMQGNVQYLLLASDAMKLRVGMRVVVTGHVAHGIMTHCQQGQPFQVTTFDQLTP